MNVVITQPNYLPWLGYFNLLDLADVFIFLDSVQWTRSDWRNRNRILKSGGQSEEEVNWQWLTVPVHLHLDKDRREYLIKEVQIDQTKPWVERHLNLTKQVYRKYPYFSEVFPWWENTLNWVSKSSSYIANLNVALTQALASYIGIPLYSKKILRSSNHPAPEDLVKTDRLIYLLNTLRLDNRPKRYFSGPKAKEYLEGDKLQGIGYEIVWQEFHTTEKPPLSILHHLFEVGPPQVLARVREGYQPPI